MKNKNNKFRLINRRAFTLPEVLVSIAILGMVIVATTSLVVSAIRTNNSNTNTIIAYGLAQEGLEAIRNIRDSNWLLGAKFNGALGSQNIFIWGEKIPDDGESFFTIEENSIQQSFQKINDPDQLQNYVPWKLHKINSACSESECEETLLSKIKNEHNLIRYVHNIPFGQTGSAATPFHRYLKIKAVPYIPENSDSGTASSKFLKMRVESVVEWKEFNRDKKVILDTELTDWKPAN